jgi:hypothetical protein
MNEATTQTILVIFLSLTLLVFLVLAIIAASLSIQVLRNVREITRRAEETTSNLADLTKMIGTKVAPVALSAAIAAAMRRLMKSDINDERGKK